MENAGKFPKIDVDTSYAETVVPEPASLLLLGTGLLGFLGLARKRKTIKDRNRLFKNAGIVD